MKKTVRTVALLCLAAVLLCSGACFATASYVHRQTAAAAAEVPQTDTVIPAPALGSYVSAAYARAAVPDDGALKAADIYELACRQVVGISSEITGYNYFGQMTSNAVSGTGFILTTDGYILTNHHVVEDALKTGGKVNVKLHDGSEYEAEIVGVEGNDNDIAVLKIDAEGLSPVTLGNSDAMLVGEDIYVVGNPLGELTYTMTSGIVSALDREIATDNNVSVNMFQLDAAVNAGNSGGPVYNELGQVVGVVTAKYKSTGIEGLGFAIPINDAKAIADELIAHGYITGKAYLGITVTNMTSQNASRYNSVVGVYVYSINPGGCAENAGLKQGDVIVEFAGEPVETIADLSAAKKAFRAGDSCEVKVYRSGEYLTLTLVLDEEPPQTSAAPSPAPAEAPADEPEADAPDRQAPGGGQETPANPFGGDSGGFDEWANDFFGRFFDFFGDGFGGEFEFGGGSGEDGTEGGSGGYRHFGF